ncbi:kinase-like domain-containing protein [Chytridium lagenaria]|nr:kinase-like domain-containing protein [Chytridium lagenaria]
MVLGADDVRSISDAIMRVDEQPYFSPEILYGNPASFSSDIYALGTILWELAYCAIPFDHFPPNKVLNYVLAGKREGLPTFRPTSSDPSDLDGAPMELAEAIRRCWHQDPTKRPTAEELDEMLFDVYRLDIATSKAVAQGPVGSPGVPRTVEEWRDQYLRIRSGLSAEDLVCVRVISNFWNDARLPPEYLPADPTYRRDHALKWLMLSVDHHQYGGAAYEIGKLYYGGIKNEEGRRWIAKGVEYGHPMATIEMQKYKLEMEKSVTRDEYRAVGKEMEVLSRLKSELTNQKRNIRKGQSVMVR